MVHDIAECGTGLYRRISASHVNERQQMGIGCSVTSNVPRACPIAGSSIAEAGIAIRLYMTHNPVLLVACSLIPVEDG